MEKFLKDIKNGLCYINNEITKRGCASETQYIPLAVLGLLGFPLYYFSWHNVITQAYENSSLRIVGFVMCIVLALKNYWPKKIKFLLPYYWYCTIFYTLSFFFAYMLFRNNASDVWLMTLMTGLVLLMLVTDWISFTFIFVSGICLAWVAYIYTVDQVVIPVSFFKTLPTYLTVLAAGALFVYRSDKARKEKFQAMYSLAANIAHELRTPLAGINAGVSGIKDFLPDLINTYQIAKEARLVNIALIHSHQFSALKGSLNHIETEVALANTVINMVLMNVKQLDFSVIDTEICSISECINEAIDRYTFLKNERELIGVRDSEDFLFKGKKLLTIHVLFNLMKNSLYYIKAVGKGSVEIWTGSDKQYNCLYFQDTSAGIPPDILPHIFDPFFSRTYHGYGVGLSFCKMVMVSYGGSIACESVENQYTKFILKFPKNYVLDKEINTIVSGSDAT